MAELVGGAFLGAAVAELLDFVIDVAKKTMAFKSILMNFQTTLSSLKSTFNEIDKLGLELDLASQVIKDFMDLRLKIESVVGKCSEINVLKKAKYAKKLEDLEAKLLEFFQLNVQAQLWRNSLMMLKGMMILERKINRLAEDSSGQGSRIQGSVACGSKPELPKHKLFGLDEQVKELKKMMLEDDVPAVVITAMPGSGKTTLAMKFCHDVDVEGKFGDNIYFATVSSTPNIQSIVRKLFGDIGDKQQYDFRDDIHAIEEWGRKIKDVGIDNILLVLDDVWPKEESVIENFDFRIPGYKLLVTSRYDLKRFDLYKLKPLSGVDAQNLFCYSAFPNGIRTVPNDLVTKVVEGCKGSPLALTVVGGSLYRQPLLRWKSMLKKWSEGESIIGYDPIRKVLQTSLDALDELPNHIKECYLDLGLFQEDERIKASILKDLWVDLYDLDHEEGLDTHDCLYELSTRNLITLELSRKDASEVDSSRCNEHYVMQHDFLRELVIHSSSQDQIEWRTRLIIDIKNNSFPEWWTSEKKKCYNTQFFSISTDETFTSNWYDLDAPNVKVVMLKLRSMYCYNLLQFLQKMVQIKAMIIEREGLGFCELGNIEVFTGLSNLRRIAFRHVSLPSLFTSLEMKNLYKLSLYKCKIEQKDADWSRLFPNLVELDINIKYFVVPVGLCKITSLKKLSLVSPSKLLYLPEELGMLVNLEVLVLFECLNLQTLPESIGELHKLRVLDITMCYLMSKLPMRIGELHCLEYLYMVRCGIYSGLVLPSSVKDLQGLLQVQCHEGMASQWRYYKEDLTQEQIMVIERIPGFTF